MLSFSQSDMGKNTGQEERGRRIDETSERFHAASPCDMGKAGLPDRVEETIGGRGSVFQWPL
jgi:hypothetical protein